VDNEIAPLGMHARLFNPFAAVDWPPMPLAAFCISTAFVVILNLRPKLPPNGERLPS